MRGRLLFWLVPCAAQDLDGLDLRIACGAHNAAVVTALLGHAFIRLVGDPTVSLSQSDACANGWSDWCLKSNQEGQMAFRDRNFAKPTCLFEDLELANHLLNYVRTTRELSGASEALDIGTDDVVFDYDTYNGRAKTAGGTGRETPFQDSGC